ncbi:Ppx/GppA phosphatase family protein [Lutibacter maritimus]|jgi:exopolyphosphatase/guanosine-5'-triphosphate,3'-diphosphate pyrophosphatase|uniref:Exopolyphosphatase / guanosine-5'-triphosphate,3'-diphosphate pyrophosphatase n=1 Tax=Lutibacter maritimus TaxID=593133 RepID=A0A1I6S344_9FLAO|nr:rod shape-determining protein [Lutibacter maritimus]SFS71381.1 exopolyphosphatase / guanosine-5'-triphosphate,3'-diphosphate pyrophosphatase [Lutibacter maritimus]
MKIEKLAAIDIGSNAIRLLVANVITERDGKEPSFTKSALVRVPIRLGADTFNSKNISEESKNRMIKAMEAFKLLMEVHGVQKYKACATSAMREAKNGKAVTEEIFEKTNVKIDVIDGKKEAAIIFSTDLSTIIRNDKSYIYVDVGGGSTEITIFSNGKIVNSKSFKIGTVRLLNKKNSFKDVWENIEIWLKGNTQFLKKPTLIGSGGNINKIFKLSGKMMGEPLSLIYMKAQYNFLKSMTYDDRISELGLNPDRADVIIPATKIYLSAMKWSGAKKIYVPKIGLADGIVKSMYYGKI